MPSEGEVNSTWVDLRRSVHRPPLPVVPLSSSSSLKLKLCLILRLFSPVGKTAAATLRYYLPRALSHALSYTLIVSCLRLASTLLHAPSLSRFDQSLVAFSLADFPDPHLQWGRDRFQRWRWIGMDCWDTTGNPVERSFENNRVALPLIYIRLPLVLHSRGKTKISYWNFTKHNLLGIVVVDK